MSSASAFRHGPFVPGACKHAVLLASHEVTMLVEGRVIVGTVVRTLGRRFLFRAWGSPVPQWIAFANVRRASIVGAHRWQDRREAIRRQGRGESVVGTAANPWPVFEVEHADELDGRNAGESVRDAFYG
jgi:hypothetical protein